MKIFKDLLPNDVIYEVNYQTETVKELIIKSIISKNENDLVINCNNNSYTVAKYICIYAVTSEIILCISKKIAYEKLIFEITKNISVIDKEMDNLKVKKNNLKCKLDLLKNEAI